MFSLNVAESHLISMPILSCFLQVINIHIVSKLAVHSPCHAQQVGPHVVSLFTSLLLTENP